MSHDWPCRCARCRAERENELWRDGVIDHPWKQDQADIDRERDEAATESSGGDEP
jgi:hypothetical protein